MMKRETLLRIVVLISLSHMIFNIIFSISKTNISTLDAYFKFEAFVTREADVSEPSELEVDFINHILTKNSRRSVH